MSVDSNFSNDTSSKRVINVKLVVSGETLEDYKYNSDSEILEAFCTYYNIKRKDFYLES